VHFDIAPGLTTITQAYGCTDFAGEWWVPASVCQSQLFHAGVDLGWSGGDPNSPQLATRPAKVLHIGIPGHSSLGPYAVCLEVDGSGEYVLYGHLASASCFIGEHVEPGYELGVTGALGYATGNHAHIEVRNPVQLTGTVPGATRDPMPYLTFSAPVEESDMTPEQDALLRRVYNLLVYGQDNDAGVTALYAAGKMQPWPTGFGALGTMDAIIHDTYNELMALKAQLAVSTTHQESSHG
jgi:hypothetical protein